MTYVAYYWKAFQQYAQAEVAGRRVSNMVGRERALDEKRLTYESAAADLQAWVHEKTNFFVSRPSPLPDVRCRGSRVEQRS
jgi:hypothetical protein